MKEFITAVEDIEHEIAQEGKDSPEERAVKFTVDGREMWAYPPTQGQLVFMMAAMGRGQTQDTRLSGMVNIMMECLREDDKDYLESRLLTQDPKRRLPVSMVENIFEHLVEEWFGRPTQSPSDSANSQPSDGQNSTPSTT